ncbi:MAG: bacterial proteasome activator family protein [Acidimicrobiia bacterium]|nr:bacterial proteasome activator family protein [Acidimicrobiia bacterium]
MSDQAPPDGTDSAVETPEVVNLPLPAEGDGDDAVESVNSPARVMRIGSMIKQLLEEVRQAPLDDAGRDRLKQIYETSVQRLAESLSPDLREELCSLAPPFVDDMPSDAELRVAQAQLVGWLEGLFHGIQATLFAQQMAARQQIEHMRSQLGAGPQGGDPAGEPGGRLGTYL